MRNHKTLPARNSYNNYKRTTYMSRNSTYQAATAVAPTIEQHFLHQITAARQKSDTSLATPPTAQQVEAIVDTAFWASLRHEEGRSVKISLAFVSPEQAGQPILFSQLLPLTPAVLTKLAPGVDRPGIHVGVWVNEDGLYIWGSTRVIPSLCFVVDVSEPGLLVVKTRRLDGFGKFANVAVLKGDQVQLVEEKSNGTGNQPDYLSTIIEKIPALAQLEATILVLIAVSMRAHKRGGSLLIVPADSTNWQNSLVKPVLYSLQPSFTGLATLLLQKEEPLADNQLKQDEIRREIDAIAGLTAIDGATIMNNNYELLAFGTKLGRPVNSVPVEKLIVTEPIIGSTAKEMHPAQNGGTRHLSVAQFIYDQPDTLGLVASQDGKFTVFSWSQEHQMVNAHLIDALLL